MYMTEMYKLQFGFDMFTYVCVCDIKTTKRNTSEFIDHSSLVYF